MAHQLVVHLPEPARDAGRLGRERRGQRVRVHLEEREVPPHQPDPPVGRVDQLAQDRCRRAAVRALEVTELEHGDRGVGGGRRRAARRGRRSCVEDARLSGGVAAAAGSPSRRRTRSRRRAPARCRCRTGVGRQSSSPLGARRVEQRRGQGHVQPARADGHRARVPPDGARPREPAPPAPRPAARGDTTSARSWPRSTSGAATLNGPRTRRTTASRNAAATSSACTTCSRRPVGPRQRREVPVDRPLRHPRARGSSARSRARADALEHERGPQPGDREVRGRRPRPRRAPARRRPCRRCTTTTAHRRSPSPRPAGRRRAPASTRRRWRRRPRAARRRDGPRRGPGGSRRRSRRAAGGGRGSAGSPTRAGPPRRPRRTLRSGCRPQPGR